MVSPRDKAVLRVDARTDGPVRRVGLPDAPDQAVFADGAVWVTSSRADAVLRVDPTTFKVKIIRVGNGPRGIAFGADRVWVANSRDGTVSAINPHTNEVLALHLGFRPVAVAVHQRAVWVTLAA